jgi:mannose-6-phosphate isomerase-like protein (cupin superfamily)
VRYGTLAARPTGERATIVAMGVRRVVTGRAVDGTSVFVADDEVETITAALMPGTEFHPIWGSDRAPTVPTDGSPPDAPRFFPPPEGFRFLVWTIGPAGGRLDSDLDVGAAITELEARLPGLLDHNELDNPGMHTTETVDFDYVVSGEVVLELDDGATVHLHAGDCVVQNGTRHRWTNPGAQPCTIVTALVGAHHNE